MPAIITHNFRRLLVNDFIESVSGMRDRDGTADTYYLFIGRVAEWTDDNSPTAPYDNYHATDYEAWRSMIAMKKIAAQNITFAVPIRRWVSGTQYKQYDDRDADLIDSNYYVLTNNNNVYICLVSGSGVSTFNPDSSSIDTTDPITTSDGYMWKYLYTIPTNLANQFITTGFMPVYAKSGSRPSSSDPIGRNHWDVQDNATDGAVYNIKMISNGSGYTSAPSVSFAGDGTGLTATATVTAGAVSKITVNNYGSGYTECQVKLSGGGGSNASARAIIGPAGGFGNNATVDLQSHFAILNMTLTQSEGGGDFIVGNDFRQIGVIRNPLNYHATRSMATRATASTLSTVNSLTVPTGTAFPVDSTILGSANDARAIVVHYDSTSGELKYQQNDTTGYGRFAQGNNVKVSGTTGNGPAISALTSPEALRYSGEIIYLENRTPVQRAADQTETIKIIFEL